MIFDQVSREAFSRAPLSRRLVTLMVSLLAGSLLLAGTLMVGFLQQHLTKQVDRQLLSAGSQLATTLGGISNLPSQTTIPSEYFVRVEMQGKEPIEAISPTTQARAGYPNVLRLLLAVDSESSIVGPKTVGSDVAGSPWRAVSLPITAGSSTTQVGRVTIALPLTDVTETLADTAMSFILAGTILVILASLAGFYLVRRSLAPLRKIEEVAGAIAMGDLSRRIPYAPPETEVGSLSSSLNTMLVQIERSFGVKEASERRMRQFVSDASHELRTPLASIRGYGELYRLGAVDSDSVADVMSRIEAESTRMGRLVEDLLTLARLDEKPELNLTEFDLVELAQETASDLRALDPTRTIRLHGIHGQRVPKSLLIEADRNQIIQVFVNLAGNIARYTPEGSPVEIALGATGGRVIVEFKDHGPGVPPEDQVRVFERFYRKSKSRSRDEGGSGLGLSIVNSIVEAHSGEVTLWETDPHGLTVRMNLPAKRDTMDRR